MYDRVEEKCCTEVFISAYFLGVMYGTAHFSDSCLAKRLDAMCEWSIASLLRVCRTTLLL